MMAIQENVEQMVIDQLKGYKALVGKMRVLEKYPIGMGMYLSTTIEEDRLQDLHRMLKSLPSYMYLTKREQEIESVAHAYMTRLPIGTKSQVWEVRSIRTVDEEDRKLLDELQRKIERVWNARQGDPKGFEAVLKRLSELQEVKERIEAIEHALETLEGFKPTYAKILRLAFIDQHTPEQVAAKLNVSRATYYRWQEKAIKRYAELTWAM